MLKTRKTLTPQPTGDFETYHYPILTLRPYQHKPFEDLFLNNLRYIIRILHRRAGKDAEAVQLIHMAALRYPALYFYLLPKINQARTVIWEGRGKDGRKLMDCIHNKFILHDHQTTMSRYLTNGSIIRVAGSDNYEALIGSNPRGIVFSEYSLCHPNAWHFLRPILAENQGWALFNYTPRGMNHGYQLYMENKDNPDWSTARLSVDDTVDNKGNKIITPEIIESERRAGMPESLIQQEFYCDFSAAVIGAYFSDEIKVTMAEGRICDFKIDPSVPVHSSWDLGVDDKNVIILWQREGPTFKAFYHYENSRKSMFFYIDELARIQQQFGFKRWGNHFAPHDIMVQEYGPGKTRFQQAMEKGFRFTVVPKVLNTEGIQCIRYMFPNLMFHAKHTRTLLDAIREHKSEYDFDKKVFGKNPVHDWTSHSIKALQYFAVGFMNYYDQPQLHQQKKYARLMP